MYFRILHDEVSGELTYLLADVLAKEAVLIDPRDRDLGVLTALLAERDLRLRWILRTHHHDHLRPDHAVNLKTLGAPLVQGDGLENTYRPKEGELLPFGNEVVRVMATPGHTASCLSFQWRDRIFCGGLLSMADCPAQPYAEVPEQLWESVTRHLFSLPNETLLFSGHAQRLRTVSTVMDQRRWHPTFTGLNRDEFMAAMARLTDNAKLKPSTISSRL
jgi:glyoxylase-like metal-dependent hydrolase (beta-lactamase superfamily II)